MLLTSSTISFAQEAIVRIEQGAEASFKGVLVPEATFLELTRALQTVQSLETRAGLSDDLVVAYKSAWEGERELRIDAIAAANVAVPQPSFLDEMLDTGTLALGVIALTAALMAQ